MKVAPNGDMPLALSVRVAQPDTDRAVIVQYKDETGDVHTMMAKHINNRWYGCEWGFDVTDLFTAPYANSIWLETLLSAENTYSSHDYKSLDS